MPARHNVLLPTDSNIQPMDFLLPQGANRSDAHGIGTICSAASTRMTWLYSAVSSQHCTGIKVKGKVS